MRSQTMYVISYDISDTKRRNKIFKLLKAFGQPRQYSLFECELTQKKYRELYRQLFGLMESEEQGNIRIYSLCSSCSADIKVIGIDESEKLNGESEILFI